MSVLLSFFGKVIRFFLNIYYFLILTKEEKNFLKMHSEFNNLDSYEKKNAQFPL